MPSLEIRTPFYALHQEKAAKLVAFSGYLMPLHYDEGIRKEHLHCREKAGLFDVSHMGIIRVLGSNAALELETIMPMGICDLSEGQMNYGVITNELGGIVDDVIITRLATSFLIVINASRKSQVMAHFSRYLSSDVCIDLLDDHALLALQGPLAVEVLAHHQASCADLSFMSAQWGRDEWQSILISRSGYTGEDGFELMIPVAKAELIAKTLLSHHGVKWCGLGARDSLRLEAGLCLYGHELNEDITPIEAGLKWVIGKERRESGKRGGGFLGSKVILSQLSNELNHVIQKRVGLEGVSRAVVRENTLLYDQYHIHIGMVSSGAFSPSTKSSLAMGYLNQDYALIGTIVYADVRGTLRPMRVVPMPFIHTHYHH